MICGCPNCKPYQKHKHQHCNKCLAAGTVEQDGACCICVKWRKRINLPPEMSLAETRAILKERALWEAADRALWEAAYPGWKFIPQTSDKYIEAINGARKMRHDDYLRQTANPLTDRYDYMDYYLKDWFDIAHERMWNDNRSSR